MCALRVVQVEAADTHPLRLLVLRPGGTLDDCRWPIDAEPDAFHLAVDDGPERICVASFQPADHEAMNGRRSWQLRGMATHPDHRGRGAGRLLVQTALDMLRGREADVLWCNARLVAVPFYERLGFAREGQVFDIPRIGPHYLMWRTV